jgi:DNA polymerase I-like protein with 3'-5' exonuclease and polymerase domains
LPWENTRKKPSINDYAGSMFKRDGLEIVFIDPLKQLISVPHGPFVARRYISKLTEADSWMQMPAFSFTVLDASNEQEYFNAFQSAILIAVDIETFSNPPSIRCIGYSALFISATGEFTIRSVVLPLDSLYNLAIMRKFNYELQAPKVLQNGKYDISYLCMYNAPLYNYLFDTAYFFHAWYSELPKDLGFLAAFNLREAMYWKDLAETNDLMEYYNALDTHATLCAFISMIQEAPAWAFDNYLKKFPCVFPTHMSEMIGIKRDMNRLSKAETSLAEKIDKANQSLQRMTATPGFNVNSPKQVMQLLTILGCSDIKSTDEKNLAKVAFRHPLNALLVDKILDIRGNRKLLSTYLTTGKEFNGRILYSINQSGTDTGRNASKEHHFWCGLNIQNIPRGVDVKQTLVADDGFMFAECDLEQAESRDTAFIVGDESLISAVTGTKDFHSVNASAFFGIPYDAIYSDTARKVLDKVLRDLAKRVNHGANYNMGPQVLVETMGLINIYKASNLLKLPKLWGPIKIAEYLLAQFHRTYPMIAGVYYPWVINKIALDNLLTGATGWTRYCFGNAGKDKRALNAYVAHCPQSLNAMVLDMAYCKVFHDIAMSKEHGRNFKLNAQIHDSILFQFREGHEYLIDMVKERMEIPITIKGLDGKVREFTVPAAAKAGKDGKGAKYWSETE